jgi:multidrug efflux pump subunit AcrB
VDDAARAQELAILMASLGIAILGFVELERLPIDLFPNINLPIINIGTIYTGAGVLDIEKTVTYPIEKAVSAISDVKFVESKSRQGLSTVRVWMNWGADVNNGQTEVIQRIQQILNSLPTGIKQPFIVRFDLSNIPVALVTVTPPARSPCRSSRRRSRPSSSSFPRSSSRASSSSCSCR